MVKIESIDVSKIGLELNGYYTELINLNIPEQEEHIASLKSELETTLNELEQVNEKSKEWEEEQGSIKVKFPKHSKGKWTIKRKFFPKTEFGNSLKRVLSVFAPIFWLLFILGTIALIILLL